MRSLLCKLSFHRWATIPDGEPQEFLFGGEKAILVKWVTVCDRCGVLFTGYNIEKREGE